MAGRVDLFVRCLDPAGAMQGDEANDEAEDPRDGVDRTGAGDVGNMSERR